MSKTKFAGAIILAATLAAGCASQPPRPTAQLARAHSLVDQADQNGAQQFASADLAEAHTKLAMADQQADKQPESARRLADEAAADAQLADARARQGKAEQAVKDVSAGVATLRNETNREQSEQSAPVAPAQSQ
jgi:hypothetical protein